MRRLIPVGRVLCAAIVVLGLAFAAGNARGEDAKASTKTGNKTSKPFTGQASYYGQHYKGRTASGVSYDPQKFTAAHRTLPFGTRVRVTETRSKRSVVFVVNDRGPFIKGRVIDLSLAAAEALKMTRRGVVHVVATVE